MNHQLLQFLPALKVILAVPDMRDTDPVSDESQLASWNVTSPLVEQMIVQESVLPELKVEAFSAYFAALRLAGIFDRVM